MTYQSLIASIKNDTCGNRATAGFAVVLVLETAAARMDHPVHDYPNPVDRLTHMFLQTIIDVNRDNECLPFTKDWFIHPIDMPLLLRLIGFR